MDLHRGSGGDEGRQPERGVSAGPSLRRKRRSARPFDPGTPAPSDRVHGR
ncbi:hypothetical protein A176_003370 [Myxococcus hansupus]|uniref:Uncharacterized protein n=1 Tax=Pseudomyxococcus hansupus TaxID=1297742 RepID=A0A0H4WXX3_9BACT|nr:hypothetical protein A176_003370 [Myxococcus hansupus]